MTDLDWMTDAECAQIGTEFFFVDKGGNVNDAKKVCAACPVAEQCLEFAQTNLVDHGIWGGRSPLQRLRMRTGKAA